MAGESVHRIVKLQYYFNGLASSWDTRVSKEALVHLGDIVTRLDITPGSRVLDIGSGTGILVPFLVQAVGKDGIVVEVDISAKMLQEAGRKGFQGNVHYVQADAEAVPLPVGTFDLVICNNTFPHFSDKLKTLREMARVIKSNGRLVICHTMSREAVNNLHQTIGGVVGNDFLPTEAELYCLLSQAGFEKVKLEDSPDHYLVIAHRKSASGGDGDVSHYPLLRSKFQTNI